MTPGCWFLAGGLYGAALTAIAAWWVRRRRQKQIAAGPGAHKGRSDGAITRPRAPRRPKA